MDSLIWSLPPMQWAWGHVGPAVRFEKESLWVEDLQGTRKVGPFDTIVIAMGSTSNNELFESLKGKVQEVYVAGDASKPKEVMEAIRAAEEIAINI